MSGGPSPPPAPDPNAIIQAQEQANRINQNSPFGSQSYGPGGLTTSLNPQMQNGANLAMNSVGQPLRPLSNSQGFGQLQQQIMGNMMQRMQGGGPGMLGQGGQGGGPPGGGKMTQQGGGAGAGQMPPPFQAALGRIWGMNPQIMSSPNGTQLGAQQPGGPMQPPIAASSLQPQPQPNMQQGYAPLQQLAMRAGNRRPGVVN
jgi:hypothetical protein